MPFHSKYSNFNKIFEIFLCTKHCTCCEYFYTSLLQDLCISMPCRRTQHAHNLNQCLFFGLLFLENFDLSQLKKPPFAFNSNSTGKWSLTPSACKTTAQRVGSHPHHLQALPVCALFGCGEVACELCISLGVMVTSDLVLEAGLCSALSGHCCLWAPMLTLPHCCRGCAVPCLPAPRSSEIPPGNQRC